MSKLTDKDNAAPIPSMFGDDPVSRAWRSEQAHVDADIAGLARDPAVEAMVAEMQAAGLSDEEQIERLTAYFRQDSDDNNASA